MQSEIKIDNLELEVYLGWSEQERKALRPIQISMHLKLPSVPKATLSDMLQDTLCYQDIEDKLIEDLSHTTVHLLERFAYSVYQSIQHLLPPQTAFSISVTKSLGSTRGTRTFSLHSDAYFGA